MTFIYSCTSSIIMFKLSVNIELRSVKTTANGRIIYDPTIVVCASMEGKSEGIELFVYEFDSRSWEQSRNDPLLYLNNGLDIYDALMSLYCETETKVTVGTATLTLEKNGVSVELFDPMDILVFHDTETDDIFNIPIKREDIRMMANRYARSLDCIFEEMCVKKPHESNLIRLVTRFYDSGNSQGTTLTMVYSWMEGWTKDEVKTTIHEALEKKYLIKKRARYFLTTEGSLFIDEFKARCSTVPRQARM